MKLVGTSLIANLWKIQHDATIWPDPEKFQPERFLAANVDMDLREKHFELIPFGSGRRMCPGISFALQFMHVTLARPLHAFELASPADNPVDMS